MNRMISFIKMETVLSIAVLLAVISAFFVPPDLEYIGYIDFRTLAILFCLMAVMAGLKEIGVFMQLSKQLLRRLRTLRQIVLVLVMLCFFGSMLITNDVALITFVPLAMIVLDMLGEDVKDKWLITVVVMQTIAANLGSMLTPIGNPQNLYLYGKSGMDFGSFINLMLPYCGISLVLLLVWIVIGFRKERDTIQIRFGQGKMPPQKKILLMYVILFIVSLLTVARIIPYQVLLLITCACVFIMDRRTFRNVDYFLLLTFVAFFVFIGNMGRIDSFHRFLEQMIQGRELITAVLCSQVMSNVPSALLLSGFTEKYETLVVGTNLGGLGTLIASMASLISFKYVTKEAKHLRGTYMIQFTLANILFLLVLMAVERWI